MKIKTFENWTKDLKLQDTISEFISRHQIHDVKVSISETRELLVILYTDWF